MAAMSGTSVRVCQTTSLGRAGADVGEKGRRLPVVDAGGTIEGMLSIDDIILWGLGHGGIKRKPLVNALRSICAAHNPMFETEDVEVCPVTVDLQE